MRSRLSLTNRRPRPRLYSRCHWRRCGADELEEKITERIKPYWEGAKRVTRLIGNGYLLFELNAIWKTHFRQYN